MLSFTSSQMSGFACFACFAPKAPLGGAKVAPFGGPPPRGRVGWKSPFDPAYKTNKRLTSSCQFVQKKHQEYAYKFSDVYCLSNFLDIQKQSFKTFLTEGLIHEFKRQDIRIPWENASELDHDSERRLKLIFYPEYYKLLKPKLTVKQAIFSRKTYNSDLYIPIKLVDDKNKTFIFDWFCMAALPLMTSNGHFIINGLPRMVMSQIVRSPGVYFKKFFRGEKKKNYYYTADFIGQRGSWLRLETDFKQGEIWVKMKNEQKISLMAFLKFLGVSSPILNMYYNTRFNCKFESPQKAKNPLTLVSANANGYSVKGYDIILEDKILQFLNLEQSKTLFVVKEKRKKKKKFVVFDKPISWVNSAESGKKILVVKEEGKKTKTFVEPISRVNSAGNGKSLFWKDWARVETDNQARQKANQRFLEIFSTKQLLIYDTLSLSKTSLKQPFKPMPLMKKYLDWDVPVFEIEKNKQIDGLNPLLGEQHLNIERLFIDLDIAYKVNARGIIDQDEFTLEEMHHHLRTFFVSKFFNKQTYNLSIAGRARLNQTLGLNIPLNHTLLTEHDILFTAFYLVECANGKKQVSDIDHLNNRKLKPVGELLQNQLAIGLERFEESFIDKINGMDEKRGKNFFHLWESFNRQIPAKKFLTYLNKKISTMYITPQPINTAFKDFFGSNPLAQMLDQTNPLAEITHKRRLSSLGIGGVNRQNAGMDIRGIHPTHYGRICPIETPEGQNAGLVNSLTIYANVTKLGFIQTPFYETYKGFLLREKGPVFFLADQEKRSRIAPGDIHVNKFNFLPKGVLLPSRQLKTFQRVDRTNINYIALNPLQMISIATSLIPFLEHDDGNRALMGSNMQRQAVPTLKPTLPIVGTGLESKVISDIDHGLLAKQSGLISYVDAKKICLYSPFVKATPSKKTHIDNLNNPGKVMKQTISNKLKQVEPLSNLTNQHNESLQISQIRRKLLLNKQPNFNSLCTTLSKPFLSFLSLTQVQQLIQKNLQSDHLALMELLTLIGQQKSYHPTKGLLTLKNPFWIALQTEQTYSPQVLLNVAFFTLTQCFSEAPTFAFNSCVTQQSRKQSNRLSFLLTPKQQASPFYKTIRLKNNKKIIAFSSKGKQATYTATVRIRNFLRNELSELFDPTQKNFSQKQSSYFFLRQHFFSQINSHYNPALSVKSKTSNLTKTFKKSVTCFSSNVPLNLLNASKTHGLQTSTLYKKLHFPKFRPSFYQPTLIKPTLNNSYCNDFQVKQKVNTWNQLKPTHIENLTLKKSLFYKNMITPTKKPICFSMQHMGYVPLTAPQGFASQQKEAKTQEIQQNQKFLKKPAKSQILNKNMFSNLKITSYWLNPIARSNQDTYLLHRPLVKPGQWVEKGDILADNSASCQGELAIGKNLLVGYTPWEGYNFEDAVLLSDRVLNQELFSSIHVERYEVDVRDTPGGIEEIVSTIPSLTDVSNLDKHGVIKVGTWVKEGDVLVGKRTPTNQTKDDLSNYEQFLNDIVNKTVEPFRDTSLRVPSNVHGRVVHVEIIEKMDDLREIQTRNQKKILEKADKDKAAKKEKAKAKQLKAEQTAAAKQLKAEQTAAAKQLKTDPKPVNQTNVVNVKKSASKSLKSSLNQQKQKLQKQKLSQASKKFNIKPKSNLSKKTKPSFHRAGVLRLNPMQKKQIKRLEYYQYNRQTFNFLFFDYKINHHNGFSTTHPPKAWAAAKLQLNKKILPIFHQPIYSRLSFQKLFKFSFEPQSRKVTDQIQTRRNALQPESNNKWLMYANKQPSTTKNQPQLNQPKLTNRSDYFKPAELQIPKRIKRVNVYIAEKRNLQVGDKIAGRHGNKGIISTILPQQDMPYLPDGTPLDLVLNPLGVPSRMNVGQIFECLLGLAGSYLHQTYKIQPFDELYGCEASRSLVYSKLYEARVKTKQNWLFDPNFPGKVRLFDGRTGHCFDQPVTVGKAYILKLIHLVDEKIHARSTGPYSLVTQQPLRGRSNKGGQRVGEMEVWALEGFGAAYILQELLTVKSDDMIGRSSLLNRIVTKQAISLGPPESFRVLLRELQALCLETTVYAPNSNHNQNTQLSDLSFKQHCAGERKPSLVQKENISYQNISPHQLKPVFENVHISPVPDLIWTQPTFSYHEYDSWYKSQNDLRPFIPPNNSHLFFDCTNRFQYKDPIDGQSYPPFDPAWGQPYIHQWKRRRFIEFTHTTRASLYTKKYVYAIEHRPHYKDGNGSKCPDTWETDNPPSVYVGKTRPDILRQLEDRYKNRFMLEFKKKGKQSLPNKNKNRKK